MNSFCAGRVRFLFLLGLCAVALVAAGCGDSETPDDTKADTAPAAKAATTDETPADDAIDTAPEPAKAADVLRDCPGFDVAGTVGGAGAGYYDISTRNIDCATARRLILARSGQFPNVTLGTDLTCARLASEGETAGYRCANAKQPPQAIRFSFGA